jgi:hypothetical protein
LVSFFILLFVFESHVDSELLPTLLKLSPHLVPLLVTRSHQRADELNAKLPLAFPAVQVVGNPPTHILRLGLIQPLGGGSKALDAIVLIDPNGKRRLILPFGWGAGRHIANQVGGNLIQQRFQTELENGVARLSREIRDATDDFYSIAATYF